MDITTVHEALIHKSYADVVPHLAFIEDHGDCCGWAKIKEVASIPDDVDVNKLILVGCTLTNYTNSHDDMDRQVLNFVFKDKQHEVVLGYELSAGSGSGWSYGAYAKILHGSDELAAVRW